LFLTPPAAHAARARSIAFVTSIGWAAFELDVTGI
jgi:hypothetical protein